MWAYTLTAPCTFERQDVPAPGKHDVPDNHVLLRLLAGGICGSDIPRYHGHQGPIAGDRGAYAAEFPGYPLHEIVGEVTVSHHDRVRTGAVVVGWASEMNGLAEYVGTHGSGVYEFTGEWHSPTST